MTDEGFTLENIFIDGIGNQISNITLNSHNEMNALTKKKKIGLIQNSRIKTIKRTKKLSLKHNKNLLSQSKKEKKFTCWYIQGRSLINVSYVINDFLWILICELIYEFTQEKNPMSVLSKDAIKDFLSLVIYPLMRRHIS